MIFIERLSLNLKDAGSWQGSSKTNIVYSLIFEPSLIYTQTSAQA